MDLRTVVRVVARHWVVVTLAMVITAVVAVSLALQIKPTYEATGSMLVLTPSSGETDKGRFDLNPLTNPGQVAAATTALVEVMQSAPYAERMKAEGVSGAFTLSIPPNGSGAILGLKIESVTPEAALAEYETLVEAVKDEVIALQRRAQIPESTWIQAEELNSPTRATAVSGGKMRVLVGVLLLGFGASFSLAFVADMVYGENRSLLRRRRDVDETHDIDVAESMNTDWGSRRPSEVAGRHALMEAEDLETDEATDTEPDDPNGTLPEWRPKRPA